VLQPLKAALIAVPIRSIATGNGTGAQAAQAAPAPAPGQPPTTRGEVNIMADKSIPYSLLKKVMTTAGEAQFARIALTVNHRGTTMAQAAAAGGPPK
jgi:hypothetical protein